MILGHRHSVPIRLTLDTNHLGGRWPLFLADHRITEVYGHNHLAYNSPDAYDQ